MAHDPRFRYLSCYPGNALVGFDELETRGELLELSCWQCGKVRRLAGDELVVRYSRSATIGSIYGRLFCRGCGARSPAVEVIAPLTD